MRACERSRIQTEVQKGAPFLYDIGTSCNKRRFGMYDNPQCFRHCARCAWNWLSVIYFPAGSYGLSEGLALSDKTH